MLRTSKGSRARARWGPDGHPASATRQAYADDIMTTSRAAHRRLRNVALSLAAALVLTACGGGDDKASADSSAPMPGVAAPSMPAEMPSPERGNDMGGGRGEPSLGQPSDGRAIVRTAYLELIVDDGAIAIASMRSLTEARGGHVSTTALSRGEDGTVFGSLTLRVPSERLDDLVDALDALARAVPIRSIDEYDVTLQLSDLGAQLENLRAYEVELRALLTEVRERGGDVEGLVTISDRLRSVRTEIDQVEAWRTRLRTDVAMSTVTVSITPARSTTPVIGTWDLPGVVRDAIAATVRLGQFVVEALVWVALTFVPALIVLALVILIVRRTRRARRRSRQGVDVSNV